ncbi:teicoplanin resistance protein VanZ [Paenibacillus sp. FSL R7-0273]|uniref:VanZ family protein n=1 Tax=Paenibacillus sp. FSL R7-0273 TaxID=1536772 RepID=UPI0004F87952|nr:VanZ family protein [Paenibacillus sp. FSL R7-0273]AIQ47759.1 teicoplanin resistance protein VanZ [Paenibacillus sp. FSL R7-0273]OMF94686.1 VanZ family protein [Paenibacillus sp. FSL R7-0273]
MQVKQQRKITFIITIGYTLIILYFMLFAFGRADKVDQISQYTFIFLPDSFFRVPGLSDLQHPTLMDLVGIGNFAAFIPFGILLPLLYRTSFVRFMTGFILSILVVETIQALTFLGSFDTNDVIQNSLGAAIGFGAYKIGFRTKNYWRNIAATGIASAALMLGVWGVFGIVDQVLTKEVGPFVAINEWKDSTGNPLTGTRQDRLKIGGQDVKPEYNVYDTNGKKKETYTYSLGNKGELYLSLNYGIPDHKDFQGSIKVTVDGQELLSVSAEDQLHEPDMRILYITRAKELKITIEGNETLWDVGYREMVYTWN